MMSTGILPAKSIDRRLLRAASKFNATAQDLSEAVNGQLTPAQALDRAHTLLDEVTIFDEVKERRLLLIQMAEHLAWMQEQRENPKSWASIPRIMKLVSDQIERANINIEDVSTKLAAEQARMFVEGFVRGFDFSLRDFAERHEIVIDEEEVLELTQSGAVRAEEYLDKVTAKRAE